MILYALHKGIAVRFFKGEWVLDGEGFIIFGDKAIYAKDLLGMQFKRVVVTNDIEPMEMDIEDFLKSSVIILSDLREMKVRCSNEPSSN